MSVEEVKDYFKMSDGFNLFFRHWKATGKAEKSIVCVHGLGCHSEFFKPIGENLAANGVEVYSLDLRGFGNSKEEGITRGDTRDFKRHMQDLDEAVDFVRKGYQNQKVYMFGHSLGGCYTLWYAANHPDSLDGVMLAAPNIESGLRPPRRFLIELPFALLFAPKKTFDMYEAWPPKSQRKRRGQNVASRPIKHNKAQLSLASWHENSEG